MFKSKENIETFENISNLASLDSVLIALLCFGFFIIIVSIIGFVAIKSLNRLSLVIYEILVLLLFLAHLGTFIALLVLTPKLEEDFKNTLNSEVDKINNNGTSSEDKYNLLYNISGIFDCCGANGPNDFQSEEAKNKSCQSTTTTKGCSIALIEFYNRYSLSYIIIPNSVILFFEILAFIFTIYFLCKAPNNDNIATSRRTNNDNIATSRRTSNDNIATSRRTNNMT